MPQVVIPGRFNGPPESANGGFACYYNVETDSERPADTLRAERPRRHAAAWAQ